MMTTPRYFIGASALAALCTACGASRPTAELQTARNAYSQARSSEAAQYNPLGVHEAYKALRAAEAVHEDDPGSARERGYAYVAVRKSELAIARASEALARKEQERAQTDYQASLERRSQEKARLSDQYAEQLGETREQLSANAEALSARERELAQQKVAAERAQNELRRMEAMREEAGRLVISLSGVLFESGGDELSAEAQGRLDTVAQALSAYPDRNIVVEGHTDDRGSDATNHMLSQKRADAVREYLASRGVSAERMRSIGRGESAPIASNDSAEGRANNRRVEVIVEPAPIDSRRSDTSGVGAGPSSTAQTATQPGSAPATAGSAPATAGSAPATTGSAPATAGTSSSQR
jgi:outer membrane protein OmpA-like peptidoglycan-associated protein